MADDSLMRSAQLLLPKTKLEPPIDNIIESPNDGGTEVIGEAANGQEAADTGEQASR